MGGSGFYEKGSVSSSCRSSSVGSEEQEVQNLNLG